MTQSTDGGSSVVAIWERARAGDLRGANDAARRALDDRIDGDPSRLVELNLVRACCFMRQGSHAKAQCSLDAAAHHASSENACAHALRVGAWRAELAYFQGRYSDANDIIDRILPALEKRGDLAYVAFVLRVRIAILLARADYKAITALADRAIRTAEASADDYVLVGARVAYQLSSQYEVMGGVTNLFDVLYEQSYGLPREGRTGFLTLRARFR